MNRRAVFFSGLYAFALAGCGGLGETKKLRYRLKLYVHVDGKEYTGSSVLETRWFNNGSWAIGAVPPWQASATGDAVTVNLGAHGLLFGLLDDLNNMRRGFGAGMPDIYLSPYLPRQFDTGERYRSGAIFDDIAALRGEYDLEPSAVPILIRFRDLNDVKTAELVEPGDFASIYGPQSTFDRATISVATEPITRGIEKRLPWLSNFPRYGGSGFVPLFEKLGKGNFSRGN